MLIITYTLKGSFASDVNVILNVTLKIKEINLKFVKKKLKIVNIDISLNEFNSTHFDMVFCLSKNLINGISKL